MVEMEENYEGNSGDEVNDESHKKLLSAVSRIYTKQRVQKPKRSEPFSNVSEYHLSNYESNQDGGNKVEVYELVNVLDKKASHQKVQNKFKALQNYSNKLAKPLEKVHADKIKRSVGYEHLKKNISRWTNVIQQNRAAPQLKFPLKDKEEVQVYQPLSFLHTFSKPTELEIEMAKVLKESGVAEEESKKEESLFSLSLPEIIEKRKLMAGLKAKESFKIVKAIKQNKIKSKKYRRILRKEKMKQALKDFETLQKTDPEAALEQLNKIEKERAEERATLRHRNTGKWAQSKAIRAKYDVEARKELAEQINKSRELTQKNKTAESSSSDEENSDADSENEMESDVKKVSNTSDNPWTSEEQEKEQSISDFIAGYQNYWKNKKNGSEPKQKINKAALKRLLGKDASVLEKNNLPSETNNQEAPSSASSSFAETSNIDNNSANKSLLNSNQESASAIDTDNITSNKSPNKDCVSKLNATSCNINKNDSKTVKRSFVIENVPSSKSDMNQVDKSKSVGIVENEQDKGESKLLKSKVNKEFSSVKKRKRRVSKKEQILNVSGSWEVDQEEECGQNEKSKTQKKSKTSLKKNATLDDIFDQMEDSMHQKVQKRLNNFEELSSSSEEDEKPKKKKKKVKKSDDSNPRSKKRENIETTSVDVEEKDEEIEELLKIIEDGDGKEEIEENRKEPVIDPGNFLSVKPRLLNAQVPDVMTEGDDMLDDPDNDRRMKISEAFADDDVVEEFRQEKEDEVKASQGEDIDLFLPGWGDWTGPNINEKAVQRKRKRFFKRAPKLPRKDNKKPNVILNNDLSEKYKEHFVSEVPFPFTSVRAYEASIRAPLGSTFVPEQAVVKLTRPPVVKKMGAIIEPMNEDQLVKDKKQKMKLKINNINDSNDIK